MTLDLIAQGRFVPLATITRPEGMSQADFKEHASNLSPTEKEGDVKMYTSVYEYAGDDAQAPGHRRMEGLGEGKAMVFILVARGKVNRIEEEVRAVVEQWERAEAKKWEVTKEKAKMKRAEGEKALEEFKKLIATDSELSPDDLFGAKQGALTVEETMKEMDKEMEMEEAAKKGRIMKWWIWEGESIME